MKIVGAGAIRINAQYRIKSGHGEQAENYSTEKGNLERNNGRQLAKWDTIKYTHLQ